MSLPLLPVRPPGQRISQDAQKCILCARIAVVCEWTSVYARECVLAPLRLCVHCVSPLHFNFRIYFWVWIAIAAQLGLGGSAQLSMLMHLSLHYECLEVYMCVCVCVYICVRLPAAFFIMQKMHTIFLGNFFPIFCEYVCVCVFLFFEMHSTQIARFGSCIFCVHRSLRTGEGVMGKCNCFGVDFSVSLSTASPSTLGPLGRAPFHKFFSGVFVAFAYVVLILIACRHRHCCFWISFHLFFYFLGRPVRVVCMLSPILSFVNTAIICVPWWWHYVLKFGLPHYCLAFFGHTCPEWLPTSGMSRRMWASIFGQGVGPAGNSKDNYARTQFGTFSDLPEDAGRLKVLCVCESLCESQGSLSEALLQIIWIL